MIKEEPEDDISIPLHPKILPSPAHCKEEPNEECQNWGGQDLEEGVVQVQKVEGLSGNRTVFRQGKQVVFRDEDGSGEDEDIMVDSGRVSFSLVYCIVHKCDKMAELNSAYARSIICSQTTTRGTW